MDGIQVLTYRDHDAPYVFGQVGFSNCKASHTHYARFAVKGYPATSTTPSNER